LVADSDELAKKVCELLADADQRRAMGEAARRTVEANQGATGRNLAVINDLLLTGRG